MAQFIDKSAVVAEIEKRIADNKKEIERASHKNLEDYFEGYEDALTLFKEQFLNTLEVKEVDNTIIENLNKLAVNEIKSLYTDIDECIMDLITARSKHDSESIENIYWRMETLMINTQQVISYVLRHIEDSQKNQNVKINKYGNIISLYNRNHYFLSNNTKLDL